MNSTITAYWKCLVEKDKNFILDGVSGALETYLYNLEWFEEEKFQYIKQGLSLTIKIDFPYTYLEMGKDDKDINYIKIQNDGERPCYYFIISKTWKATSTIELVLSMDTLNTFAYDKDYKISPKTLVKRMHKDRFAKMPNGNLSREVDAEAGHMYAVDLTSLEVGYSPISGVEVKNVSITPSPTSSSYSVISKNGYTYIRVVFTASTTDKHRILVTYKTTALLSIVDLKSEEINVPTYKTEDQTIYEVIKNHQNDWSLYYKAGQNENDPIECYLVPEQTLPIKYQATSSEFNNLNVPSGKYLIFASTYPNGILSFKFGDTIYTLENSENFNSITYKIIALHNDSGTIKIYTCTMKHIKTTHSYISSWQLVYTGTCEVLNAPEYVYSYEVASLPNGESWFLNRLWHPDNATHSTQFTALIDAVINGKDTIDKTLSENIKIINIPYSPTPYKIDNNGAYTFESCWTFDVNDKILALNDFNAKWKNEIDSGMWNLLTPLIFGTLGWDFTIDFDRQIMDPKLYHSDYYRPKFVYDSFTKIFPLEKVDYENSNKDLTFKFDFIMSRNIVSKFLFKFNQIKYKYSNEDYDNIVAVSRNNEEVLYNSAYINYIRTGYNYDLKAKERTETASGIGIGLNVASLIASLGLSLLPGGKAVGLAGGVASVLGLGGQLVNYAKTTAQNEENIQRKLQEAQMQGISVLNADDSDLLEAYSENKAKYCLYTCSEQMQKVLDDLFFYCGYVINAQMKPVVNSRRSFNYVQASLVINENANLTNEIIDDIKEKFEQGVTFLHYSFGKFDFNQDKENIENSILSVL